MRNLPNFVYAAEDMKDEVAIYPIDPGGCPQARAVKLVMAKSGEYSPEEIVETVQRLVDRTRALLYR